MFWGDFPSYKIIFEFYHFTKNTKKPMILNTKILRMFEIFPQYKQYQKLVIFTLFTCKKQCQKSWDFYIFSALKISTILRFGRFFTVRNNAKSLLILLNFTTKQYKNLCDFGDSFQYKTIIKMWVYRFFTVQNQVKKSCNVVHFFM